MLYLIAAILGSSSLVILLKLFDTKGVNLYLGITVNYIVAALLSFLFSNTPADAAYIASSAWIWAAVVVGIMFALSFVVYAFSAQRSGVAITTIAGRAALVIPVAFAFIFLDAQVTFLKIAMLLLIMGSMFLILHKTGKNKNSSSKNSVSWVLLLPLAVFLFNGLNDTIVQYSQSELVPQDDYTSFNGTMFIAGALMGFVCYVVSQAKDRHTLSLKDILWGSLLGLMNWVCMTGVLYGLDYVDGSVFYPLYYTGAIVISTLIGVFAFKEKLSPLNYIGIGVAIIGIAVLSAI